MWMCPNSRLNFSLEGKRSKIFLKIFEKQCFQPKPEDKLKNHINLRGNGLRSIQNIFRSFDNLISVNVGENSHLQHLLDSTFSSSQRQLKVLTMDRCKLGTLPPKFLKPLTGLEIIDLSHNFLQTIPDKFFHNLKKLKHLNLGGNKFRTLHNLFPNIPLEFLDLRWNSLNSVGTLFKNASFLKKVNLKKNNLKEIAEGDFKNCKSMEYLIIGSNFINRVDKNSFINLKKLKYLDISSNKLKSLNGSLRGLQDIEILRLRSNTIVNIHKQEFFRLNHLKKLDLAKNRLRNVSGAFDFLVSLMSLTLQKNKLSVLPRNAFPRIMTLHVLQLSSNKWICDCRLSWLRQLYISKNISASEIPLRCSKPKRFQGRKITDISAEDLVQWTEDCPKNCKCTCIPKNEMFYVEVNCSDRCISEVPIRFPKETGMLLLQDNRLTNLTRFKLAGITDLRLIDLERNFLTSLNFTPPETLDTLKLAGNNLTRFFKSPPEHVSFWTLSNNPWICDCKTEEFRKWILSNRKYILDVNSTRCSANSEKEYLSNKIIVDLLQSDLCPVRISTYIVITISFLILLLVGTSSKLVYSSYHYHMKVWLYSRGFKWLKKTDDEDIGKIHDAFISSADQELYLVKDIIAELENNEPRYTLFEPRRDMKAGEMFQFEKEMEEVTNSKRVIILLSENYLQNNFLMEIFKVAFNTSLKEKLYRLILITVGELPSLSGIDESLKAAIESTRCLRPEQKLFWDMLRFAMPKKEVNNSVQNTKGMIEAPQDWG